MVATGYGKPTPQPAALGLSNPFRDPSFEVFSPPNLFYGPRPVITKVQPSLTRGQTLRISTPDAADVSSVTVVRNTAMTTSGMRRARPSVGRQVFVGEVPDGLAADIRGEHTRTLPDELRAREQGSAPAAAASASTSDGEGAGAGPDGASAPAAQPGVEAQAATVAATGVRGRVTAAARSLPRRFSRTGSARSTPCR